MDRGANPCFLLRAAADDFLFEAVNRTFETSTGLKRVRVVGHALRGVLPTFVAAELAERCWDCLSGAAPMPFLCVMPSPAGQALWEVSLAPRFDEGRAVMDVCATAHEVGEGAASQVEDADGPDSEHRQPRKRVDQAARSSPGWSRLTPVASTSKIALLDRFGVIVSVNAAWRESVEEIHVGGATHGVGMSYQELCKIAIPGLDGSALAAGMSDVAKGYKAVHVQPYVIVMPNGVLSWRWLRIVPARVGPPLQLIAIHDDITDADAARAALHTTAEQLLSAQAHERERIAFELHDSTGQHLTALGLGLIRLKRLAGDGAAGLIADMSKAVEEMVREIRVLSYLMKPAELESDGLVSAARLFVSGFGARTGLNVEFRTEGGFRDISDTVQNAAFRILQEALSNVYRHAGASHVEVDLTDDGGALNLRISDNGWGIPLLVNGQFEGASGVGFASMGARVAALNGTLKISRGAVGTIVEATIARR